MHLRFAVAGGFPDPLDPDRLVTPADMVRLRLPEGLPFVVTEGGEIDERMHRFFKAMPGELALGSHHTWRGYANDIGAFAQFLGTRPRPKTLWEANADDVDDYHMVRCRGPKNLRLTAKSWNRAVAALECFFGWAFAEGLVAGKPFHYKARSKWRGATDGGASLAGVDPSPDRNAALEGTNADPHIVHIALSEYVFFREVGLRGLLPNGEPDPACDRHVGDRNAAFADLLLLTGMRVEEGGSLLLQELPPRQRVDALAPTESCVHDLVPKCVKGKKRGRKVYVPARTVRDLLEYVDVERADATVRGGAAGVYAVAGRWEVVTPAPEGKGFRGRAGDGRTYRVGFDLDPRERRRLLVSTAGGGTTPASLFLNHRTGEPLATAYWDAAFRAARKRCKETFGRDIACTPHVLRHTFAMNTLSDLIAASAEHAMALQQGKPGDRAYEVMFGDAMAMLRDLLGHVSVATTHLYLRSLRDARGVADQAAARFAERVYGSVYADDTDDDLNPQAHGAPGAPRGIGEGRGAS